MEKIKTQFQVKGIQKRIDPSKNGEDIKELWETYWSKGINNQLTNTNEMPLGIYYNYEKDQTKPYDLLIGHKTQDSSKDEFTLLTIPKQKYVIFERKGKMPEIIFETWKEVWDSQLERTFNYDIEEYLSQDSIRLSIGIKEKK